MDIKGIFSSAGATIFIFGITLIVGIVFGGWFIFTVVLKDKQSNYIGDGTYILAMLIYIFWIIIVGAISVFLATQIFF